MFGKLMDGIDDDYLRYVFHVQVLAEPAPEPDLAQASYLAADDPVQGDGAITAAFAAATPAELEAAAAGLPGGNGASVGVTNRLTDDGETQMPIVKAPSARRSDATSRAGAGAARSTSSATAPTEMGPADGARRGSGEPERVDLPESLDSLADRLAEAEHFLGRDRLLERRTELEKAVSEPGSVGRPRPRPGGHHRVGSGHRRPRACSPHLGRAAVRCRDPPRADRGGVRRLVAPGEVDEMLDDLDRRLGCPRAALPVRRSSTTTATPWPRSMPGPGAPTPRTGRR